ncbi:NADH-quinone oxidoreductase subunit I [Sphingobacterium sp. GVS05A]|uniref:NADH-quinone oxidoreductase subunit I n=1 Tax=Sphingobacterium sp. GVS05A TaxID=2862679 RepID=UPI001CBB237F|nr:4Fe-4S dicluster domain-containing protein [Sphingobacterium sp. GVS05A]
MKIRFKPDECIVCLQCVPECPVDALSYLEGFVYGELNIAKFTVDLRECIECGDCVEVCPTKAITLEELDDPIIGTGDGGHTDRSPSTFNKGKVKFNNNMSDSLVQSLLNEMNDMNPCSRSKLLKSLEIGKNDITFVQNPKAGFLGFYNASTKTLEFSSESIIGQELLSHEFFHAFQDQNYTNMGNYGPKKPGHVNIEFEQYVFQSISFSLEQYSSVVGKQFDNEKAKQDFKEWISDLTTEGTVMPNLSNNPEFLQKYNEFLSLYNQYGPPEYRSPQLDLSPNGLLNLFDETGC